MKRLFFCVIIVLAGLFATSFSQTVSIVYVGDSFRQAYAASVLKQSITKKGYTFKKSDAAYVINFLVDKKFGSEAFSVEPSAKINKLP